MGTTTCGHACSMRLPPRSCCRILAWETAVLLVCASSNALQAKLWQETLWLELCANETGACCAGISCARACGLMLICGAWTGDDPSIRPLALTIPALDLLVKPAHEAAPAAFFQRWASLPAGVPTSCRSADTHGLICTPSCMQTITDSCLAAEAAQATRQYVQARCCAASTAWWTCKRTCTLLCGPV